MGARNAEGPAAADLSAPQPVGRDEIAKRIAAGEWVVDLRDRTAFAEKHLAGSIGFALEPRLRHLPRLADPWGAPLTLLGETGEQIAGAQRQLVRIGIDRPAGAATGSLAELAGRIDVRGYPRRTFADLAAATSGPAVLDVRRDDERAGGGIAGAVHIPLDELEDRTDEVPRGTPVWVHCASGFRASIAASLLDRAGRHVVAIHDDWGPGRRPRPPAAQGGLTAVDAQAWNQRYSTSELVWSDEAQPVPRRRDRRAGPGTCAGSRCR